MIDVTRLEIAEAVRDAFKSGPASRPEMVALAERQGARGEIVSLLEELPGERRFAHLRDIWAHIPDVPVGAGAG
ncbi:MAG: DUF2795 domain-containing protein [Thermoleophilaceae bacterium]